MHYERYHAMVFWEVGKLASILRHRGDNINTVDPNILQNLLGNENTSNINIGGKGGGKGGRGGGGGGDGVPFKS